MARITRGQLEKELRELRARQEARAEAERMAPQLVLYERTPVGKVRIVSRKRIGTPAETPAQRVELWLPKKQTIPGAEDEAADELKAPATRLRLRDDWELDE